MLQPIKHIIVDEILDEMTTKGSGPLKVLGIDGNIYYAKSTVYNTKHELINEIICSYLTKFWGLKSPEIVLLKFSSNIIQRYKESGKVLSSRYKDEIFNDLFFGSKEIQNQTEIESYFRSIPTKKDFKLFESPLDIIKISVFDMWIGNKDRKPENPNILLSVFDDLKFNFVPIDHTAAFGYISKYNELKDFHLFIEEKYRIINVAFKSSIVKFANNSDIVALEHKILEHIENCLINLDFIFEQIPSNWGFSNKSKKRIKEVLSNNNRNVETSKLYLSYMK